MDPFVYVGNRPVIHVDPKGLAVLLETHHVIFGYDHSKVTILPSCQTTWLSDSRFKNRTTSGKVYATIGADGETGKLVSDINRPTDVDRTHNKYADLIALPGGIGEDEFIRLLFDTDAKYKDSLDYELVPQSWTDGYNSNSFACGLLKVTTGAVPTQPPNTPGFEKPVPAIYFH